MIIDENFPKQCPREFDYDELQNKRILLIDIEKNILELTKAKMDDSIEEYTIDTGQSKQQVKRGNFAEKLKELNAMRRDLVNEIAVLEKRLGIRAVRKIARSIW